MDHVAGRKARSLLVPGYDSDCEAAAMTLPPELEKIRRETEAASAHAQALSGGLDEEQLGWRPRPESWSIAENLLHLDLTTRAFLPVVDRAIEEARGKDLRGSGPFRLGLMGKFYV
jgi:DinB superfamily